MTKRALILGIGGMDGSYLADILLAKGYEVHGAYRKSSYDNLARIAHVRDRVTLHRFDMLETKSIRYVIEAARPDVVYNEADQDSVEWSHVVPFYTEDVGCHAVDNLLNIAVSFGFKLFQPCSATIFGDAPAMQDESTKPNPMSPYAKAKLGSLQRCMKFRDGGVWVTCGILYNHDSPRRGDGYLLQKICRGVAAVALGKSRVIPLGGDLTRLVDVGYAGDYMDAAVRLMELPSPGDYIISAGRLTSIETLIKWSMAVAGFNPDNMSAYLPTWGVDKSRVDHLCGDATRLRLATGWEPRVSTKELVEMITRHHLSKGEQRS